MKTITTAVFALSLMLGSAFGAVNQDTTKSTTSTKSTTKAKKSKKAVKSTSASVAKPAVTPVSK